MPAEVETMFYNTEVPWHGLGKKVDNYLTSEEAIKAAGLDWTVDPVNLFHNFQGNRIMVEGKVGLRRNTDGRILSVLSPEYKPVQNAKAFEFFDSVVGTKSAIYDTAGSLRNGQKIWILAKVTGAISVKGDQVDKYIVLMNSHDGTVALKMFFTPVRVVCMNTLNAAEAGAARIETFYAKHTGNIATRMERAREILGMTNKFYEEFAEQANRLANAQLPPAQLPKLLAAAFGTTGAIRPEDVVNFSDFGTTRRINEMEKIYELFGGSGKGLDIPNIRGTKWAAYNAIVEYIDYAKQFRGKQPEDNRLEYAWIKSMNIKHRAWNYLLKD